MSRFIFKQFLVLLFISFVNNSYGQSKNTIRENNIQTLTVYETRSDKDGKEIIESVITYDTDGNVIEEKEFNNEGRFKKHVKYVYDQNSNKIKEMEYNEKGEVIESVEYKYDGKLKTERIVYDEKGKIINRKKYEYKRFN